jgi:hypothetical protein
MGFLQMGFQTVDAKHGDTTEEIALIQNALATRTCLMLLLEHFFDLPDLLFNFASILFGFALSL